MSLYYDAVSVLTASASTGGSFKSRIYNARNIKASPAQIYALVIEASKWDILLKEVIENAGILKLEPKVDILHVWSRGDPAGALSGRPSRWLSLTDQVDN